MSMSYDDILFEQEYEKELAEETEEYETVCTIVDMDINLSFDEDSFNVLEKVCENEGVTVQEAVDDFTWFMIREGRLPYEMTGDDD